MVQVGRSSPGPTDSRKASDIFLQGSSAVGHIPIAMPELTVTAPTLITDAELLLAHQAGDPTAFERIYARHRDLVWRSCRRQVPAADIEDAVQAVFLVLLRLAERLQTHPCLPAW